MGALSIKQIKQQGKELEVDNLEEDEKFMGGDRDSMKTLNSYKSRKVGVNSPFAAVK